MDIRSENVTEDLILEAARKVFMKRGYFGARMQEIADEAGINKSLLHYYFRSKDKLFEKIIADAIYQLVDKLLALVERDIPFEEKIGLFVHEYMEQISKNPYLPGFLMHELSFSPEKIPALLSEKIHLIPASFFRQIKNEMAKGNIIKTEPLQIFMNIFSLAVFPLVARPLIQFINKMPNEEYDRLLEERKHLVTRFILNGIKAK